MGLYLDTYFKHHNIDPSTIYRKIVNSGLIAGYAKDICHFCIWALDNHYTDDQKAFGAYMNAFPDIVYADTNKDVLHTTSSFINVGLQNKNQMEDAPTFAELIGRKSFFLHIPGIGISKGVNHLYENIYNIIEKFNGKEMKLLYPNYDLDDLALFETDLTPKPAIKDTLKGYQFIVITASNERKQLMEEQFSALNSPVDVHYLDASTPLNSQDYLKDCGKEEREYGLLCCTRSHIRALEYASQNKDNYKYSIILEDDVAFLKEGFLSKIEEVMGNWNKYDTHKMVSIGWVPCNNYGNYTKFNETLSNDTIKIIIDRFAPGMQGYMVKNDDIPYMDSLIQPTYIEMDKKVKALDSYKVLATHFGEKQHTMVADVLINRLFSQAIVFPPLMIERDIPSMLGHNNINTYWANYFKGHETERDKYRLSTKKTTLEIVDKLVENEKRPLDTQYQQFNNSRKIKCLWLRYIDDKSSWYTDTTKLWGPDTEAEYIVDILTDDSKFDNIEFLSIPSNFNISVIKNADVIAYSSNKYSVDYISKLVDILKPKALIHLSDEFGHIPQYKKIFDKVQLVYRQYKFPNKSQYHDEINDTSIKYLPLGYHSWGKKYIRGQPILPYQRTYKWCFSGSLKNERTSQIEKLSQIAPYFCQNTNAFETTEMFRNSIFAFCPSGNSNIECSRIYEAMYNGCIPIIVGDKVKHNLDHFKNMFEIPLPCYFVYSIDEALSIIQSTGNDELIKIQEHCLQWVQNIGDKIRGDIVNITNNDVLDIRDQLGKIIDIQTMEKPEQDLANEFIRKNDVVLELGARYGSVSCTINNILNNKQNQVVVEPDDRVWNALEDNRHRNNCDFHIVKGFISNKNLDLTNMDAWYGGYGATFIVNDDTTISSYTLDEIKDKYKLCFNVLVADCEGFLEEFFDENPTFYDNLRLIIFEADYPDKCNYNKIKSTLQEKGFTKKVEGHQNVWIRNIHS